MKRYVRSQVLKDSKGSVWYHHTKLSKAIEILKSGSIRSSSQGAISLTERDDLFPKNGQNAMFTLNTAALRDNFVCKPYNASSGSDGVDSEREIRVYTSAIAPISSYVISLTVYVTDDFFEYTLSSCGVTLDSLKQLCADNGIILYEMR